jgi:hypothetical protein
MKLFAEQIRQWVPVKEFKVLGTDGFGRSDSRKKLRHFFEVDRHFVVLAALEAWLTVVISNPRWWLTPSSSSASTRKNATHWTAEENFCERTHSST